MTDRPLVVVEWMDAWVKEDGIVLEDAKNHQPMIVHTIGWVLNDDDVGIQVANEYYDSTWRGRTFVPRGMIKSVTPFKLSKPRKVQPKNENT